MVYGSFTGGRECDGTKKHKKRLTRRRPSCGQWHCISLVTSTPPLASQTDQYDCYERRLSGDLRAVRAKMAKGWLKAP